MDTRGSPERSRLAPDLRRLFDAVVDWHRQTGLHPTLDELAGVHGCAKSTVSGRRRQLAG
jgi:hypothetical protein